MKRIEYLIQESKFICGNVVYLKLVAKDSQKAIVFNPGQYGLVSFLRKNILTKERPFSFLSSPTEGSVLHFGFKIFGEFTSEFAQLKKGDSVFVRGPYGSFVFDEKKHGDSVFLAAGIGITPFISIFRYATAKKLPNNLSLLFSNRTFEDIAFYDEIKNLEKLNPNFKARFALTNSLKIDGEEFIIGRMNEEIIRKNIDGDFHKKTFFICGPQLFSNSMINILKSLGVKDQNIKIEGFSLAPSSFFERGTWTFPAVASASALLILVGLYSITQMETDKLLLNETTKQTAYEEKINQMNLLNQQITDHANKLIEEQKNNTTTEQVLVPRNVQTTTQTSTPENSVVVTPTPTVVTPTPTPTPKPTPKPTPTPRTTVS